MRLGRYYQYRPRRLPRQLCSQLGGYFIMPKKRPNEHENLADVLIPVAYLNGKPLTKTWVNRLLYEKWFICSESLLALYLALIGVRNKQKTNLITARQVIAWKLLEPSHWGWRKSISDNRLRHLPHHQRAKELERLINDAVKSYWNSSVSNRV